MIGIENRIRRENMPLGSPSRFPRHGEVQINTSVDLTRMVCAELRVKDRQSGSATTDAPLCEKIAAENNDCRME